MAAREYSVVKSVAVRGLRRAGIVLVVAAVAGCALPRSGPTKRELLAGARETPGGSFVVEVDDAVVRATTLSSGYGFSPAFVNAGLVGSDEIRPGDVLSIAVWENVDNPLLASSAGQATQITQVQVDGEGYIFVPYAGRVRATGNSPEGLRQAITSKLDLQTPDPQVTVTRAAGDGGTVSIISNVGGSGVYPIERPTRTLSAMLAKAGGVSIDPAVAQITVKRGTTSGTIWLKDLYADPRMDIALRPGDVILLEEDSRAFTALGATGGQARVTFDAPVISALEAIAQVGGLQTGIADPTGVFVLRNEPAEIANTLLGRTDLTGPQRMVYVLDLTSPNGLFVARDFVIRDGDTLYVTEAPYVQWQKTLSAFTGSVATANNLGTMANSAGSLADSP